MQGIITSIVAIARPWLNAHRYSLSHENGNRSSKRTDELNRVFIDNVVRPIFPKDKGYVIETEHSIACAYGGKFKMDVVVYKGDKIVAMFPLKAIERSYNKNKFNFANTIVGEAYRIWGHPGVSDREKTLVAAVDWIPYKVPVGDKGKFETAVPANISSENLTKMSASFGYPNSKHISVKIRFDYNEVSDKITNLDTEAVIDFMKELVEWEKNFE
jgi:hypothetical protein